MENTLKNMSLLPIIGSLAFLTAVGEPARAAPASGTVTVTIDGTFTKPVSPLALVVCMVDMVLTPANPSGSISASNFSSVLASVLGHSAIQKLYAPGVVGQGGGTFTCVFSGSQYQFYNPQPGQQIILGLEVKASDVSAPGSLPSSTKQLLLTTPVPPSPGAFNFGTVNISL